MAIYKTDNGKWLARISYRDEYGKVKSKEKRFNLKREAQEFEVKFRKSLNQATENDAITFDEVFRSFLKDKVINVNQNTLDEKQRITDKFLYPLYGIKMNKITHKIYYDLWHDIASSNYSYSYKNKIIAQMKAIAHFAYLHYNIEDKTKTLPTIRKPITDNDDMQVWSQEQFEAFNACVDDYTMNAFFHTLYFTGMRRGECMALQKTDFVDGALKVNKSIKHFSNGFIPPKTASSKRVIRIDDATIEKLTPLLKTDGNFLFGGLQSLGITTIQRAFKKGIEESGVPEIRLHDLRHSHASYLINSGANIVAVSNRLGHANTETTLRVYTHLMKQSEDELLDILNG